MDLGTVVKLRKFPGCYSTQSGCCSAGLVGVNVLFTAPTEWVYPWPEQQREYFQTSLTD